MSLIYVKLNIYIYKIYISQTAKYHTHTLVLTKARFVQEIIENTTKIKTNFF